MKEHAGKRRKEGKKMFKKVECIVYGSTGICEVLDVTTMDMAGTLNDKLYYILQPYHKKGSEIFTPVDNKRIVMRSIISMNEAKMLLDEIDSLGEFKVSNEKFREDSYKQCVRGCNSRDMMKMIKTLHQRKHDRLVRGKSFPSTDERYLKMAEENLFSELALAMETDKEKIGEYIREKLDTHVLI